MVTLFRLNIQETHTDWPPTKLDPAYFYTLETSLPVALEVTDLLLLSLALSTFI